MKNKLYLIIILCLFCSLVFGVGGSGANWPGSDYWINEWSGNDYWIDDWIKNEDLVLIQWCKEKINSANDINNIQYRTYNYNSSGKLIKLVNGLEHTMFVSYQTFNYDNNGKLLKREFCRDDSQENNNSASIYTYDYNGNLLKEECTVDNNITVVRNLIYQDGCLVREEIDSDNDETIDAILTYSYDNNGNLTEEKYDYISGMLNRPDSVTTYIYDDKGKLIQEIIEENDDPNFQNYENVKYYYITYIYDSNSMLIKKEYSEHEIDRVKMVYTYTYNIEGNLIKEEFDNENDDIVDIVYTYTWGEFPTNVGEVGDNNLNSDTEKNSGDDSCFIQSVL